MFAEGATINGDSAPDPQPKRDGKVRLLRLADLDGRTKARRAAERLFNELIEDLGGADNVSAAQRVLAETAAVTQAMSEHQAASWLGGEPVDINGFATVANTLRRLLSDLGLERKPRAPLNVNEFTRARRAAAEAAA
jgi:hypothetical protein